VNNPIIPPPNLKKSTFQSSLEFANDKISNDDSEPEKPQMVEEEESSPIHS
jgi:hypothetical protein